MTTFSQLVDALVSECKRPDLRSETVRYVNQTIRELHFSTDRNAVIMYDENRNELSLTADVETGYTWELPDPTRFQKLEAVKYGIVYDSQGLAVWPKFTTPGRHLNGIVNDQYYYRVGGTFVFSGYGGVGGIIQLSFFNFPGSMKYYPDDATRPANYDEVDGWTYPAGAATDEDKLAARNLVSNWLLERWDTVVTEGVRAKLFKRNADTERARTSYSLYGSLRQGLWTSETALIAGE